MTDIVYRDIRGRIEAPIPPRARRSCDASARYKYMG